jgi:CRP-like cAMP-binding protein
VLSGKVRIFDTADGREAEVASIGPGDFCGELALLRDETHSKNAQAVEESELMVIPKERFRRLISSDSGLAEHVHQKMEERLRANTAPRDLT